MKVRKTSRGIELIANKLSKMMKKKDGMSFN